MRLLDGRMPRALVLAPCRPCSRQSNPSSVWRRCSGAPDQAPPTGTDRNSSSRAVWPRPLAGCTSPIPTTTASASRISPRGP